MVLGATYVLISFSLIKEQVLRLKRLLFYLFSCLCLYVRFRFPFNVYNLQTTALFYVSKFRSFTGSNMKGKRKGWLLYLNTTDVSMLLPMVLSYSKLKEWKWNSSGVDGEWDFEIFIGDSLAISRQSTCRQINIMRYGDSRYIDCLFTDCLILYLTPGDTFKVKVRVV